MRQEAHRYGLPEISFNSWQGRRWELKLHAGRTASRLANRAPQRVVAAVSGICFGNRYSSWSGKAGRELEAAIIG